MPNDFYNLTISYRKSADIHRGYFDIVHKGNHEPVTKWILYNENQTIDLESYGVAKLEERQNDIAWAASNCNAYNHREDYVQEMKDHASNLTIDIFGKCGDLKLSKDPNLSEAFRTNISPKYKFYLAFENSNCQEYVTEKFALSLIHGIVPVVMGGLNSSTYEKIGEYANYVSCLFIKSGLLFAFSAPPHSYINVNDYKTAQDLMKYLEYLSKNSTAYNSYFWWHEHYTLKTYDDIKEEMSCKFCELLNMENYESPNDYTNLESYWVKCLKKIDET